ncbi:MAG: TolB family protein, partial [Spirochaetota bacterium]
NTGFFGAARIIFGEGVPMVLVGLSIPAWYFEGDAVATETALSDAGRGRTPAFDAELRALLLNGKRYGFYKAMNGSYKDRDPLSSPYLLGYFLETRMRREYGWNIIPEINRFTSWLPLPYVHTNISKIKTGRWTSDVYEDAMDEMTGIWQKQIEGLSFSDGAVAAGTSRWNWTTHHTPRYLPDGSLAVLTWNRDETPRIVKLRAGGKSDTIYCTMPADDLFSAAGGKIVWAESVPDPRWGLAGSSDLFARSIDARTTVRLTSGGRYYAPALSPDGRVIAAVEYGSDNVCSLVLSILRTALFSAGFLPSIMRLSRLLFSLLTERASSSV